MHFLTRYHRLAHRLGRLNPEEETQAVYQVVPNIRVGHRLAHDRGGLRLLRPKRLRPAEHRFIQHFHLSRPGFVRHRGLEILPIKRVPQL